MVQDNKDSDSEESGSDVYEEQDNGENKSALESTDCLFCENVFSSVDAALQHLDLEHSINLSYIKKKFRMDQISFIKLINCIRKDKISSSFLLGAKEAFWKDEKYLKPIRYESWLTFDFEGMSCEDNNSSNLLESSRTVNDLKEKCEYQASLLEQAYQDMEKMRKAYKRLVDDEKVPEQNRKCVSDIPFKMDDAYFKSYAHFGIHHEMLSDTIRTESYRNAFYFNKQFFDGKDILDVGCGTGILSLFASRTGAKNIVGIDNSDIIYDALDIVKKNKIENVLLVKGRLEDTELPLQKYDVIISEWMGYFLFFEGMLDSMIYARDNHLKENGILLPNRCSLSLMGCGDEDLFKNHIVFWDNVFDFDMSLMKKNVLKEPLIEVVNREHILTNANTLIEIDLLTVDINYSDFSSDFNLKCIKTGHLNSFVGYFDVAFDLPHKVAFGTGPYDEPTHWKQVVFFLEEPQPINKDDIVSGRITCRRSRRSLRSLDVTITVYEKKFTYYLD